MYKIVVFVAAFNFLSMSTDGADPTSYPGKYCKLDTDCELPNTGLLCASEKCICSSPRAFYYGSLNKCVLPEGAACNAGTAEADMTPHAFCNAASIVECKPEYSVIDTRPDARSCVSIDEKCRTDDDCDEDKFQKCVWVSGSRRCGCESNSAANAQKVCELKALQKCKTLSPFPAPKCHEQATCLTGTCVCNAGLKQTYNGQCRVSHGGDCSNGTHAPCDENLLYSECNEVSKRCMCIGEGTTAIYEGSKCVLAPTAKCETGSDKQSCGKNAICHDRDSKCVCNDGFEKGQDNKCAVLYGKPCIGGYSYDECDKAASLKCYAENAAPGTCGCKNKDDMIERGGICVVGAGKWCKTHTGTSCVANANCTSYYCECAAGMSATVAGDCALDFGETCDGASGAPCHPDKFLECTGTTTKSCQCSNSDKTWYNNATKKCELRLASPCGDAQSCSTKPGVECLSIDGSSSKSCQCKSGKEESDEGLVPSGDGTQCYASFKKSCSYGSSSCNPEKFLTCSGGKCTCLRYGYYDWFNIDSQRCELFIGENCQNTPGSQPCTQNSTCDAETNKCTCGVGLVSSKDKRNCFPPLDSPCTSNSTCKGESHFVCINGKCSCDENSWYNSETKACELRLGSLCGDTQSCSTKPRVECLNINGSSSKVCQCKGVEGGSDEGLVPSKDGTQCYASYNKSCTYGSSEASCNPEKFLTCLDGKCTCLNYGYLDWFNTDTERCELMIGYTCKSSPGSQPCTKNSKCDAVTNTCTCGDGLVTSSDGKGCLVIMDSPCTSDSTCQGESHFVCMNGKCACDENSWYNSETKRCELRLGSLCGDAQSCSSKPRVECLNTSDSSPKVCQCNGIEDGSDEGLVPSTDGTQCYASYNKSCSRMPGDPDDDTTGLCNREKFLTCFLGTCSCQNFGIYDWFNKDSQRCELLIGQQCESSPGSQPCTQNSTCDAVTNTCTCGNGLAPSDDKKICIKIETTEVLCTSDRFCNACINGKCECDENSWYNTTSKACEILVNGQCEVHEGSQPCTQKSICDSATKICTCESGLLASNDSRSCIHSVGAVCTLDSNCNKEKHLLCMDGKCECDDDSWFNPKSARCELLAGELCFNDHDSQSCTEFSACEGNRGETECNCLEGYEESADGKCLASFGAPCQIENDADCNADELLTCVGGKCSCNSDSWFNPHATSCQLLAGKSCKSGSKDLQCTDYSQCVQSSGGRMTCECEREFVPTLNGQCGKGYGSFCVRSDSECADFLMCDLCEDNRCICKSDSWFNPGTQRCELFVGEFCVPGSMNQACTQFSTCERRSSGGGYECKCTEGFTLSDDGRCVHMTCGLESLHGLLSKKNHLHWSK